MSEIVLQNVKELISKQSGVPIDRITSQSRLQEDLGMTGDDAAEFIEQFAATFKVDMTAFHFYDYFHAEGCSPWSIFSRARCRPLTVQRLYDAAMSQRWDTST